MVRNIISWNDRVSIRIEPGSGCGLLRRGVDGILREWPRS